MLYPYSRTPRSNFMENDFFHKKPLSRLKNRQQIRIPLPRLPLVKRFLVETDEISLVNTMLKSD